MHLDTIALSKMRAHCLCITIAFAAIVNAFFYCHDMFFFFYCVLSNIERVCRKCRVNQCCWAFRSCVSCAMTTNLDLSANAMWSWMHKSAGSAHAHAHLPPPPQSSSSLLPHCCHRGILVTKCRHAILGISTQRCVDWVRVILAASERKRCLLDEEWISKGWLSLCVILFCDFLRERCTEMHIALHWEMHRWRLKELQCALM